MTRTIYAPGSDSVDKSDTSTPLYSPANGAGGAFAQYVKGATPKYAKNNGLREEQYRDTMARMFVRVDRGEYAAFQQSIADPQTRALVERLAGDPRNPRTHGHGVNDTGYMDFLLQRVRHSFREKVQPMEVLSDNYVAYYFGQGSPVWQYTGAFINSVQDDQASNFVRLYLHVLRGTQLARRQKSITLRYDSFAVAGTIESLDWDLASENELVCPFQMSFRVKRLYMVNTTEDWVPTRPRGPIADPHAVAFDGGAPTPNATAYALFAAAPTGTVSGPTPSSPEPRAPTPPASSSATSPGPVGGPPQSPPTPNAASLPSNPNPDVRPQRPATVHHG